MLILNYSSFTASAEKNHFQLRLEMETSPEITMKMGKGRTSDKESSSPPPPIDFLVAN